MHNNELKRKITTVLLYLISAFSVCWGMTYILHGDIMSYHRCFLKLYTQQEYDAMNQFNDRVIPLMKGLMQILGGGMIAIGVAVFYITKFSFTKGDKWSWWALLFILIITLLPIMYVTHFVSVSINKVECTSRPPWVLFYGIFVLVILAFINSWIPSKVYDKITKKK